MTVQTFSKVTHLEADAKVYLPYAKVVDYDWEDLDAAAHTLYVPIDAGTVVLFVTHEVITAFAGGTPSLTIGDSGNAANWLGTNDIAETQIGDFANSLLGAETNAKGKKYLTPDFIILTHATGLTAGAGRVSIYCAGKEL